MLEQEIAEHLYNLYQQEQLSLFVDSQWGPDNLDIVGYIQLPGKWFRTRVTVAKEHFTVHLGESALRIKSDLATKIFTREQEKIKMGRDNERNSSLKYLCNSLGLVCKEE